MVAIHFYSHRDYLFTQNHHYPASAGWRCIGGDLFFPKAKQKPMEDGWLGFFTYLEEKREIYINVVLYFISIHLGIHF